MRLGMLKEKVTFRCIPHLDHLELMHATFVGQCFSRHIHTNFAVGVVEAGTGSFAYRGKVWVAPPRTVFVIQPGEAHTGGGFTDEACTYRVMYPDATLMRSIAGQVKETHSDTPTFPEAIIEDVDTADLIRRLHIVLETSSSKLEQESSLVYALGQLIRRHARERAVVSRVTLVPHAVKRTREYLEANFAKNVSLSQLTRLTGLSGFHLTHVFCREFGLPPHAYLIQLRVLKAKQLIAQGSPIVEAALESGFVHQSHLNKHFKRLLGLTPGQYRRGNKIVQDRNK